MLLCAASAFAQSSTPGNEPISVQIPVSVARYSERPLLDYQARVMSEATKLSIACRLFRSLYKRWPSDLAEIDAKIQRESTFRCSRERR